MAKDSFVHDRTFDEVAKIACERLAKNAPVRRSLPSGGRLRFERQLPFVCLHRLRPGASDVAAQQLVTTQAAYVLAPGDSQFHTGLVRLCQQLYQTMTEPFGRFLFVELWTRSFDHIPSAAAESATRPMFEVVVSEAAPMPQTVDRLRSALSDISIQGEEAIVIARTRPRVVPPGLRALPFPPELREAGDCGMIGVAVRPIYRQTEQKLFYPVVLKQLRWQLAEALRKAIAEFIGLDASERFAHVDELGPSSMQKSARDVDQALCKVAESYDFLLQVTPVNSNEAWTSFSSANYRRSPVFQYRPLPYRPSELKRQLFAIEAERVEDPTLAHLFWEKQQEVDRQLSALRDLNTPRFRYSSMQLYGDADDELVSVAEAILERTTGGSEESPSDEFVTANQIVERAQCEIDYYRRKSDSFDAKIEVSNDIAAGMMVSHDRLLIAKHIRLRPERVEPLMHHEIGTHLLTYFNGRCQPLKQLYSGLAGYEELQEGLAVLAEFLCGSLSASRLRNLAARVLAVRLMAQGATFCDTFAGLHETYGIAARQAFVTSLRAFRGGGLTKDIIYLRGLRNVLMFLKQGHDVEPMYVGKISLLHIPHVQEMRRRGLISAPSLLPRIWDDGPIHERLELCRKTTLLELLET